MINWSVERLVMCLLSQGVLQVVVKWGDENGGVGEEKEDEQFWWFVVHYISM